VWHVPAVEDVPPRHGQEVEKMAWRPSKYLQEGELDNSHLGKVTGWMKFAGMKQKVTFDLEGDFHRDIRGAKIRLSGRYLGSEAEAVSYMDGLSLHQTGKAGDITAGLAPVDYVDYPLVEFYSDSNGRVVIELDPEQVQVVGTPIPAAQAIPISRQQQWDNLTSFALGCARSLAAASPGEEKDDSESNDDNSDKGSQRPT
jgi:hypothetical protein